MKYSTLSLLVAASLSVPAIAAEVPANVSLADEQHFVRGNGAEPATLDPSFVNSGMPGDIIANDMFEGFVIEDGQGNIIPGQAIKWETSEDGLTYTFTLRDGAKWSDGKPVLASDFVYGWQRAVNPQTGNDTGHYFTTANIKNASKIQKGEAQVNELGIQALDSKTVQITLEKPTPYLMSLMSVKTFFPLPQHVVEAKGEQWTKAENIVTNGAYILTKWVPNEFVEVKRNTNYWNDEKTVINGVTYLGLSSQNAELVRYQSGEIDMTNRVQLEQYQRFMKDAPEQITAQSLLGSYLYSFNTKKAPFDDVRVRKALTMGVDRKILVQKITGQGELEAFSPVPSTIPNYDAAIPNFAEMVHPQRIGEARKLLKEAGYDRDNPLELTVTYNTSENHKKIALAIASMWKSIGVTVKLENMEWKAYVAAKSQGDYEVARSWAFGDYPEPSSILEAFTCGHVANESGFCDEQYDAYMKQAASAKTEQDRYKLYAQAEAILADAAPIMPLYQYNHTRLVRNTLKGVPTNNPKGNIYAKDLYFVAN